MGAELAAIKASLAARRGVDVLELPRMQDPVQLARMQLLANLLSPAYVRDPLLFALIVGPHGEPLARARQRRPLRLRLHRLRHVAGGAAAATTPGPTASAGWASS